MLGRAAEAGVRTGRDRAARVLLLLAALGALFSFGDAVGTTMVADPETRVTGSWRMYGYLVFAGLFVLLAFRPRRSPGVWELVIFHKTAVAVTAAVFVGGGCRGLAGARAGISRTRARRAGVSGCSSRDIRMGVR